MTSSNPFLQPGVNQQHLGSNPYASMVEQQPAIQQNNPFFQQPQQQAVGTQQIASHNPFGILPQSQPQQFSQQNSLFQPQSQSVFDYPQQSSQQVPQQQHLQSILDYSQKADYGGLQAQPFSQQMPQAHSNPYAQQQQQPQQYPQQSNLQQQSAQYQLLPNGQQNILPQPTGRYDKSSILALYNYPQLAPQHTLASIPEPTEGQVMRQGGEMASQKRSATMPVSSMHSAGGVGNRNPFLNNASNGSSTPLAYAPNGAGVMARHASAESVQINNLQNGRHSPDAFANLSARYMKS
jgi:hypothetical protein